jgi:hypothetical protein
MEAKMATSDEHAPALDQPAGPASKSQQQAWAQDLLDTIQTNRDNNARPTSRRSRPLPQNDAEIPALAAEAIAKADSAKYVPGPGADRRDIHRISHDFAAAAQQVMGDAPPGIRRQMAAAFASLATAPALAAAERRKDHRDVGVRIAAMQQFMQLHLFEGDALVYLARPFAELTSIATLDS